VASLTSFSGDVCGVVGFGEGSNALPKALNCSAASWNPTLPTAIVRSIASLVLLTAAKHLGSMPDFNSHRGTGILEVDVRVGHASTAFDEEAARD